LVIVSVPVAGAFVKVTFPLTSYCCVATLQAVGVAVREEMLHVTVQGGGAVKFVVKVQVGSAEKVAVTVQAAPLAGNPAREYACDVGGKGGLKTCVTPEQLFVTVSVPVLGGVE
jgi:hypothetical protein